MEVKTESGGVFDAAGNGTKALGILGTVLGGLGTLMAGGNGILNLSGGNGNPRGCPNANDSNTFVSKAELQMTQQIAAKDSEIALLKSEQNTEIKIADVYERLSTKINQNQREQDAWNTQQAVNNAAIAANVAANASSIAALQNCCGQITKMVVPNSAICPGWGGVKITPETTAASAGS